MISEVYEPLKDAGVSEEKAKAAAQVLADYENRFAGLEAGQMLLKRMIGFNLAFTMAILSKVLQ
ncbi:MAG TPA: integrase [Desulfocapsa sulfexigens]|nr:integrase [Desulfocapsa sulfexigens]